MDRTCCWKLSCKHLTLKSMHIPISKTAKHNRKLLCYRSRCTQQSQFQPFEFYASTVFNWPNCCKYSSLCAIVYEHKQIIKLFSGFFVYNYSLENIATYRWAELRKGATLPYNAFANTAKNKQIRRGYTRNSFITSSLTLVLGLPFDQVWAQG